MKTICHLCFKKVLPVLILLFALAANLVSQVPTHWNSAATSGAENSFPLNQTAGKGCQWLVLAGEYNLPGPAPAGKKIHSFSLRISTLYPLPSGTYTNFKIIFQQSTITDLPVGSWYTAGNPDTVYTRASVTLSGAGGSWLSIVLDHDYAYDPAKSLIIQVEQCGWTASGGFSLCHLTLAGNRRVYSVGGCPLVAASNPQFNCVVNGIELVNPPTTGPDYLYYKFENNPNATTVLNCALPGVGTPSPVLGAGTPLTTGGQFDTCITGTGLTTGGITTGWNCNLGTSSWTINMWLTIPTETGGLAYYLFGDAGSASFRCFHNGVALPNNLVLRGGFTDVTVTGTGPNPTSVTFVYDSAAGNVKAYKNGVLAVTSTQTLNITTGTGFKVGGYGASTSFIGKMDEFRLYKRALTPAEVLTAYNSDLSGCGVVAVPNTNNQIPEVYALKQNYPNPFNPTTIINFTIPKAGYTKLVVYDLLGREVKTLLNYELVAGSYDVNFNATNLASGTYLYTLTSGNFTETKRMVIVK